MISKNRSLFLSLFVMLLPLSVSAQIAFSVTGGTVIPNDGGLKTPQLDFSAGMWYPVDQMVLLGISSGVQHNRSAQQVPATASLYLRLPIGRQLLPVATADWGYLFGKQAGTFIWRAGGGLDLKLGNHSSLIALFGGQFDISKDLPVRLYSRAGLLLEW